MRISPAISIVLLGFVLLSSPTWAEEKPKGYLGAYVRDVAEEEIVAEGLGQKERCVGIFGIVAGSPADGLLRPGDLILTLDNAPIASAEGFLASVRAKGEGATVILGIRRLKQNSDVRIGLIAAPEAPRVPRNVPMVDTGGHMALIRDIAFTPNGTFLVSAAEDTTVRIWDVATGETRRTPPGRDGARWFR
jgi:hypothetical protein